MIESARLPLPRRLQILTYQSLDRCRGISNRRLALAWCNQEMDVISITMAAITFHFVRRAIAPLNAAKAMSFASTFWRLAARKVRK